MLTLLCSVPRIARRLVCIGISHSCTFLCVRCCSIQTQATPSPSPSSSLNPAAAAAAESDRHDSQHEPSYTNTHDNVQCDARWWIQLGKLIRMNKHTLAVVDVRLLLCWLHCSDPTIRCRRSDCVCALLASQSLVYVSRAYSLR